ncbi:hypothetical protein D3C81_1885760 [compost metagenome]
MGLGVDALAHGQGAGGLVHALPIGRRIVVRDSQRQHAGQCQACQVMLDHANPPCEYQNDCGCSGGISTLPGSKRNDGICVAAYNATPSAAIKATSSQRQPGMSAALRAFQQCQAWPAQNTTIAASHR